MKNKLALLILVMFSKSESLYSINKNTESLKLDIVGHEGKRFTSEEDKKLRELVEEVKISDWRLIAGQIPGRTARQCRDRYNNYLS